MFVKSFMVNVNKRLKPFFLEQHINIVNRVTLQSFWFQEPTHDSKQKHIVQPVLSNHLKGDQIWVSCSIIA